MHTNDKLQINYQINNKFIKAYQTTKFKNGHEIKQTEMLEENMSLSCRVVLIILKLIDKIRIQYDIFAKKLLKRWLNNEYF